MNLIHLSFCNATIHHGFVPSSWSSFQSLNKKSAVEGLRAHRFCYSVEGEYIYCVVDEVGIQPYVFREKNKTAGECYKNRMSYRNIGLPVCHDSLADLKKNKLGKTK